MTLPALFKLTDQYRGLLALDAEEVPEQVLRDTLEALTGDIQEKSANVAAYMRNLESAADAIDEAAQQMRLRAQKVRLRAESIKSYLLHNMRACEISRIESPYFTLAVRKNPPSVAVFDERAVPEVFKSYPAPAAAPEQRIDRKAVADALKAGWSVPGCKLEYGYRLEVKA
jgi:hypothetical protein